MNKFELQLTKVIIYVRVVQIAAIGQLQTFTVLT